MENRVELFEGPADGMPSPTLLRRMAALTAALAAVVALTTWHTPASALQPVQTGSVVTVTASRVALTASETGYADAAYRKLQGASRYPSGREASLERPSGMATV